MKNVVKLFGIIALAAVIGFTAAGCDLLDGLGTEGEKDGTGPKAVQILP